MPIVYRRSGSIDNELRRLARTFPNECRIATLPNPSVGGKTPDFIHISSTQASAEKTKVLVIGGQHAREWAPPDALLAFAESLLNSYANNLGFVAGNWSLTSAATKDLVDQLDLYIAPMLNPDGRDYTLAAGANYNQTMWRKNRNPLPSGDVGVDVNRNHDMLWNFPTHYTAPAARTIRSKTAPSENTYIGPVAMSEAETKNIQWLLSTHAIKVFFDVHSCALAILYPWAIETTQTTDTTKNFSNAARWSNPGRRDSNLGRVYEEYAPALQQTAHARIATVMGAAITTATGSRYTVKSGIGLYPATGTAADYAFSTNVNEMLTFVIECGTTGAGPNGGAFHPNRAQFGVVKREVWASLASALDDVVRGVSSSTPPSQPPPGGGGGSSGGGGSGSGGGGSGGGSGSGSGGGGGSGSLLFGHGHRLFAGRAGVLNPAPSLYHVPGVTPLGVGTGFAAFSPLSHLGAPLPLVTAAGPAPAAPTPSASAPLPTLPPPPPAPRPPQPIYTGPPVHMMRLDPWQGRQHETIYGYLMDQSIDFTQIDRRYFRIEMTFNWSAGAVGGYITAFIQNHSFLGPRELEFEVPDVQPPTFGGIPQGWYDIQFLYWPLGWVVPAERPFQVL